MGDIEPWCPKFQWSDLIPRRYGGVRCRFYFFLERDAATIHRRTTAMLNQLRVDGLKSVSVDDYLLLLAGSHEPALSLNRPEPA
jgi:hypothetical protein